MAKQHQISIPTEPTAIEKRIIDAAVEVNSNRATAKEAIYQHSVLCQTFLPYRNPGIETRIWQRKQGFVSLAVQGTAAFNPRTEEYEFFGLPYGTKARLILAHINSEAIRTQSPIVNVEDSMSAFIKRIGLNVDGRTIKEVKNQLRRLTTSIISLSYQDKVEANRGKQVDLKLMTAFDVWFPKDERQRVLWSSNIQLTNEYYTSLLNHAIPLDERALAALAHNAMALDIYAWLAQRLHRIPTDKPQFVSWANLKEQFGSGYSHMYKFKQIFRKTMKTALLQYPSSRVEEKKNKGYLLTNSPSPIPKKIIMTLK